FQAEDGIRDRTVTGVQTCALPISQPAPVLQSGDVFARFLLSLPRSQRPKTAAYPSLDDPFASPIADHVRGILEKKGVKTVYKTRSEERRVGKEGRSRWSRYTEIKI